jgi:glycosyltransferase involved in cell wall biosynthesis
MTYGLAHLRRRPRIDEAPYLSARQELAFFRSETLAYEQTSKPCGASASAGENGFTARAKTDAPDAGASHHSKPALIFVWEQFGAYHVDRLEAVATAAHSAYATIGVEFASRSRTYAWEPVESSSAFVRHTLFPDEVFEDTSWVQRLWRLIHVCSIYPRAAIFVCHSERPEIIVGSILLRLLRHKVYALLETKFDDKQRDILWESLKHFAFRVYHGGLLGGSRHAKYYQFLGFSPSSLHVGYDTVSVERIRTLAGIEPGPGGYPFEDRHFTIVARFVEKKNLKLALEAYAIYCRETLQDRHRRLVLCGSGPLETELRRYVQSLGLGSDSVVFAGFLNAGDVAKCLGRSLALILPSREEQWGLVVNEALAVGVPILCSDHVGARDTLVRNAVNGYIFESDNAVGLARAMIRLATDGGEWKRLATATHRFAPLGDTREFAAGVGRLIGDPEFQGSIQPTPPPLC